MAEVVADRLAAAAAVGDAALRNRDVAPLANGRAPTFLGLWHISQFKASFLPPLQSKFRLTRRTASSNENLCKNFFFWERGFHLNSEPKNLLVSSARQDQSCSSWIKGFGETQIRLNQKIGTREKNTQLHFCHLQRRSRISTKSLEPVIDINSFLPSVLPSVWLIEVSGLSLSSLLAFSI